MELTKKLAEQLEAVSFSESTILKSKRKRELSFRFEQVAVCYPSGNTTAIVFDQMPDCDPKALNSQIMRAWQAGYPDQPAIEQCCFVTKPRDPAAVTRVEMFGGEFCGNATRSALWLLTEGRACTGLIEVSGVDRPLAFSICDQKVRCEMPLPQTGMLVQDVTEGWLVRLDGISQLVTSRLAAPSPRQLLNNLLRNNTYGLADQPAVGISRYDERSCKATFCVWVKAVDTIFDETACGSGSSAIGVAYAWHARRSMTLDIVQPSGETIRTEAVYNSGIVRSSYIAGTVRVLYNGPLELI